VKPSGVNVAKSNGNDSDSSGSHSLLHRQYATQMLQSGYWIHGLPITYVAEGNSFLVSRS